MSITFRSTILNFKNSNFYNIFQILKFLVINRDYCQILRHGTKFCENRTTAAELWPTTMFYNMGVRQPS